MAGIPIRSAIDIQIARAVLRKRLGNQLWSSVFKAQASAALTTIGEITIAEHTGGTIEIVRATRGLSRGIELRGTVNYTETIDSAMSELKVKLAVITDEIELHRQGSLFRVMVRIWQKHSSTKEDQQ